MALPHHKPLPTGHKVTTRQRQTLWAARAHRSPVAIIDRGDLPTAVVIVPGYAHVSTGRIASPKCVPLVYSTFITTMHDTAECPMLLHMHARTPGASFSESSAKRHRTSLDYRIRGVDLICWTSVHGFLVEVCHGRIG
eukprot:55329-Eustigmatos_ZCMA.PRE.2